MRSPGWERCLFFELMMLLITQKKMNISIERGSMRSSYFFSMPGVSPLPPAFAIESLIWVSARRFCIW